MTAPLTRTDVLLALQDDIRTAMRERLHQYRRLTDRRPEDFLVDLAEPAIGALYAVGLEFLRDEQGAQLRHHELMDLVFRAVVTQPTIQRRMPVPAATAPTGTAP